MNAIISISFVTLDKTSPVSCVSKYFNGNLFIFTVTFFLSEFANLFETVDKENACI